MEKIVLNDWFGGDMGKTIKRGELVIAAHKGGFYSAGRYLEEEILEKDLWGWSYLDTSYHIVAYAHLTKDILGKMIDWDGGVCPLKFNRLVLYKDAIGEIDIDSVGSEFLSPDFWKKNVKIRRVVAYLPVEFELSEHVKFEFKKNDFIKSISHCSNFQQLNDVIDNFLKSGEENEKN